MEEKTEDRLAGNGTVQKVQHHDDDLKFTVTEPDQMDDGSGDWGFTIFVDKDVFMATVSYASQADATRGRVAMAQALENAIFIAT